MKNSTAAWLCISLLSFLFPVSVFAYSGGDGSAALPYQIANKTDLLALAATTTDYSKYFILTENIDLTGEAFTTAVIAPDMIEDYDFGGTAFTGNFDGDGHIISNLKITTTTGYYIGLFGYLGSGGQIKNLGVVNANIQGRDYVGGLVGFIDWNGNTGVTCCYTTGSVSGISDVGGLAGFNGKTITFSYAKCSVSGTNYVGGLMGYNSGAITSCYATGTVSGSYLVGGLVGNSWWGSVISSFWDMQTSGQSGSFSGKGLTTAQMKTMSIFQNAGWAGQEWVMNDGADYPHLSWEGTSGTAIPAMTTIPLSGSGTEADPYLVTTAQEFASLSWYSGILDKHIKLTANLDMTGATLYPIGDLGTFVGVFDGNGHIVSNATISQPNGSNVGLFGYLSSGGRIKNLGLININIQGYAAVGGLVGRNGYDSFISFCYATGSVNGHEDIGGLAGYNYGTISSCYATGSVSGSYYVGGLAGGNSSIITFSYSNGVVSGYNYVGGLVGYGWDGSVNSSFWDMQISGQSGSLSGKGLTTAQMKTMSIFQNAGWAGQEWVMNDGADYPHLSWEGTSGTAIPAMTTVPLSGSGTEADPYLVTTAQEFASLSWYSGILDKHIKLTANLDMTGVTLHPIGDLGTFTGVFDGNGHAVRNVEINQPGSSYVGLFGYLGDNVWIKNLGLINVNINGGLNVGGLAGHSLGTISSCYVTGTVSGNYSCVGGLLGYNSGTIISCYAKDSVSGNSEVGGLVGQNEGTINFSYSTGVVSGYSNVGGLVGYAWGSANSCFWDILTSGQSGSAGGTGLTTIEMQTLSTFLYAGWDFVGVWTMPSGGYPILSWQTSGLTDIIIGTGTGTWNYPLSTYYHDSRTQIIYLASEIGSAKTLNSLALNVSTKPGQTMNNFTIRLKNTDLSAYGTSPVWESSGWTVVYQANQTISAAGWTTFIFTTPFSYSGTQNLMVDISFNNSSSTSYGYCRCTSLGTNRSISYRTNSSYGDPLTWSNRTPTPGVSTNFPNLRLGYVADAGVTVPNVVGMTQAAAQTAITTAGLAEGSITQAYSNSVPAGKIISQSPVGGQSVPSGTSVNLVISLGSYSANGDGSAGNPYQIATKANLLQLAATTADYNKCFILTANIDLAGETFTTAVIAPNTYSSSSGFQGTQFTGVFDGNGYTISNMTIRASGDYIGLFGDTGSGGQIKNLGVEGADIQGRDFVGGMCGQNNGTFIQCYAAGSVTGQNSNLIGGLCGLNIGTFSQCYSTSTVTGGYMLVGGLCGQNDGAFSQCYATGVVTGSYQVGGLVGTNNNGTISQSYSTAAVSGVSAVGGLFGTGTGGPGVSCFWDMQTSGQTGSAGGKGLTTEQMKTMSVYQNAGWADKGWVMNDGSDYPHLSWENTGGTAIPSVVIPFAGSGIVADPYLITTTEEFAALSWYSDILNKNIRLSADLDLNGINLYPIGDLGLFTGVFDGNGYILSNANIQKPESIYVGLFAYLGTSGQIRNLGIDNISIAGRKYVGGLAGVNKGIISACYVAGFINGIDAVGGLVGGNSTSATTINNCYTMATVSGETEVGGLVGYNYSSITLCYSTGTVTGNSSVGGLCGNYPSGTISNCFWDTETSGQATSAGGIGKTTTEMQTLSTFTSAEWDFANIWAICEGTNYPRLQWQIPEADWVCPDGVNIGDLDYFAGQWLATNCTADNDYCGGTDMNTSGSVDLADFAILAQHWLEGM